MEIHELVIEMKLLERRLTLYEEKYGILSEDFYAALNAGKLLSPAMLAEATKVQSEWYGYGFISASFEGFRYWGHGGGAPGNSLVLDYYPATDTTFVCMANRDPTVCDRLAFNWLFRSPRTP